MQLLGAFIFMLSTLFLVTEASKEVVSSVRDPELRGCQFGYGECANLPQYCCRLGFTSCCTVEGNTLNCYNGECSDDYYANDDSGDDNSDDDTNGNGHTCSCDCAHGGTYKLEVSSCFECDSKCFSKCDGLYTATCSAVATLVNSSLMMMLVLLFTSFCSSSL
eukprot:gb/GECG01015048.1/.p1 GENE.gb/GECG01015048.1/~~gb/GECG01015048.1/.p1  ORF type:complete len:163 (+),score=9.72 gb/GECG01015048.1/:1-489(+)